jgi:hypothetical protein
MKLVAAERVMDEHEQLEMDFVRPLAGIKGIFDQARLKIQSGEIMDLPEDLRRAYLTQLVDSGLQVIGWADRLVALLMEERRAASDARGGQE